MDEVCSSCGEHQMYCPSDWPWENDYWICPSCQTLQIVIRNLLDDE